MKRRNFIQAISAVAISTSIPKIAFSQKPNFKMIKPRALHDGDTIGVIAPATAVSDPDDIQRVIETAKYFNLKIKFGKNVVKGNGYKSRTINERLDDLHSMFNDDNVKAIFCIRGGYGSAQLLDKIDYELIKQNPKIFIGYSDITAMHIAINKFSNLITFHGPVLLSSFTDYTIDYFKKALFTSEPIGEIQNPISTVGLRNSFPLRTIKKGTAKGSLIGGNLTLISTNMGTPYEIETKNKILFLEDVGEEPYRIDRMLNQLKLSGKLHSSAAVVFGVCKGCNYNGLDTSRVWDSSLGEILDFYLAGLNIPVVYGYLIGHTSNQITIPIGVNAVLDAENQKFEIIEAGVTD